MNEYKYYSEIFIPIGDEQKKLVDELLKWIQRACNAEKKLAALQEKANKKYRADLDHLPYHDLEDK